MNGDRRKRQTESWEQKTPINVPHYLRGTHVHADERTGPERRVASYRENIRALLTQFDMSGDFDKSQSLLTGLRRPPATSELGGRWWCPLCQRGVVPIHVTYEEYHDPRCVDGCGAKAEWQPTPPATSEAKPCPCQHTTPCHERCTCVVPYSSHGCARCCAYGSPEQQREAAERLAKPWSVEELAEAIQEAWRKNPTKVHVDMFAEFAAKAARVALSRPLQQQGEVCVALEALRDGLRDESQARTTTSSSIEYRRGHRAGRWDAANAIVQILDAAKESR